MGKKPQKPPPKKPGTNKSATPGGGKPKPKPTKKK